MAVNSIQGSLVLTEVSVDKITWNVLVCEQGSKFDYTTNVTIEKTKCGPIKGLDNPDGKFSGDGVLNVLPAAGQISYKEIQDWVAAKQLVYMRKQSPATIDPVTTIGQAFFQQMEGYFTSLSIDYGNGQVVKFTYNFEGQGDLITIKPVTVVAITPTPTVTLTAPAALTLTSTNTNAGSAPFLKQWKKSTDNGVTWVPITGATNLIYTKNPTVATDDSGKYRLDITDDDGVVSVSNVTTVTVS